MASQRTKRIVAFWLSVLGHALIVVSLTFSISLDSTEQLMGVVVPIQTVMVDQAVLDSRAAEIEAERQREIQRQQDEAQRQRDEAARLRREQQLEQQRVEQEQREREAADQERIRLAAEARAAEEAAEQAAEAERQRQEQLAREEEERRQREAAERRQREEEARRIAQVQAEIAAAQAAELEARAAASSGARAQWAALISNKVQRNWQRPPNATTGLECLLVVEQVITGDVRSVRVDRCNVSDANVIRSLENAVLAASPLPPRPPGVEFERFVRITFRPTE